MAQSRYLFAMSCFQMNLLSEAEAALCPANEPSAEVLEAVFLCELYVKNNSHDYLLKYSLGFDCFTKG